MGDLGTAVAMEVRVAEVKSEPLGPFGKSTGEHGNCLDGGNGRAGEIGDVAPSFPISEPGSVVVPLTLWQGG